MKSKHPHVYKTTNLINGKIYVGQHSGKIPSYIGSGVVLIKAIKRYGKENFKCEIIEEFQNQEDLDRAEEYWIQELQSTDTNIGYNISTTANTYAMYGEDNHMFGRTHTKEAREKISKNRKPKKYSKEEIQRISKRVSGKGNPRYVDTSELTEEILAEVFTNERDWIKYCVDNFGGGRYVIIRLLKSWGYTSKNDFCKKNNILKRYPASDETRKRLSEGHNHPWKISRDSVSDDDILSFLNNSKSWVKDCKSVLGFTYVTLKNISEVKYGTRTMTEVFEKLKTINNN